MNKKILSLFILLLLIEPSIIGQDSAIDSSANIKQRKLLIPIITGGTLFVGGLSGTLYLNNSESVRFHFYNDIKEYLQVDKFLHSFGSYFASDLLYKGLITIGTGKKKALLLGGTLSVVLITSKDIYDGFNLKGFSWTDMLANTAGSALFVGQELLFNEQILKYKFSFSKSDYADQANGYLGKTLLQNYFKDYNGHTYWFSINFSRIIPKTKLPDWICIAAGYSANGIFGSTDNIKSYLGVEIPETQRYRQFLLSLDIDWSKINVKSKFLRVMLNGLNFIKVPFPAIEFNSKGYFKGYWIYF
jgi:hypothetical protein